MRSKITYTNHQESFGFFVAFFPGLDGEAGAIEKVELSTASRAFQPVLHDQPVEYKDVADIIVERYRSENGRRDINSILQYVATVVLTSLSTSPQPDRLMSPKSPTA